jgi:hypothetical protein
MREANVVTEKDFARFGEYLMVLLAATAEVLQEREAELQRKYPNYETSNDHKSDETYHEYVMSIGTYELMSRIVEVYNTLGEPAELKLPLSSMN